MTLSNHLLSFISHSFIRKLILTTGIIYIALGTVFFVSGVLLLRKIKTYYRAFYMAVRGKLWFSAVLLSFTLFLRGLLNVLRYVDFGSLNQKI